MKKKFLILSGISSIVSLAIFIFSYCLWHYYTENGFQTVWHEEPAKPLVTELFAELGVLFLFCGITSFLISLIFFSDKRK